MHYDAELRFLTDTFQKYGIPVTLADLDLPPSPQSLTGPYFLQSSPDILKTPLEHLLPPIRESTVYTMTVYPCSYTYLLLPHFPTRIILVLGPYLTDSLSYSQILEQAELHRADGNFRRVLERYYTSLPIFPNSSHLHLMLDSFFDRIWGVNNYGTQVIHRESPADIAFPELPTDEQEHLLLNAAIMEERYAHENMLIDAVRQGQTRRVESLFSRITPAVFEKRVSDPLRNLQNYCIITNTLLRKAAEQGGVHPVYIDQVSSDFALKIEQITSTAAGPGLITEMAHSYCSLVQKHNTQQYTAPIQGAILLIEGNLSGDLSLNRLAKELNVNSTYLSALFRKETGTTLTAFITQRRISYATHLLKTTRLQIQTVAQHCGFEDIHYFSRIFKRFTGSTPRQYREDAEKVHHRSNGT